MLKLSFEEMVIRILLMFSHSWANNFFQMDLLPFSSYMCYWDYGLSYYSIHRQSGPLWHNLEAGQTLA
jgi:hypothetical protein